MATPASGANAWLLLNNTPLNFQDDSENWDAQACEYTQNTLRITPNAPDDLHIWVDGEPLETERYGRWYWKPKGYAGLYVLSVSASDGTTVMAKVRVLPDQLSYARYVAMLEDIGAIMEDVLFRLHSPAHERVILQSRKKESSALKDYYQVKSVVDDLADIVACIRRSPHGYLRRSQAQQYLHDVYQFSSDATPVIGGSLCAYSIGAAPPREVYLPDVWSVQQIFVSYDGYENRLLKHFILHQLIPKIMIVQERAINEIKRREQNRALKLCKGWSDDETPHIQTLQEVVEISKQMIRRCRVWCNDYFLQSVKPLTIFADATQILLKNSDYSRFYRLYLRYQQDLKISLDVEHYLMILSLRKLSELYEIWAVFHLTEIILMRLIEYGYQTTSTTIFYQVEKNLFQTEVQKNTTSIILEKDEIRLEVKYEPRYLRFTGKTTGFVSIAYSDYLMPDMVIEMYHKGIPEKLLVFDPKYRSKSIDGLRWFLEEDVNKMRFYRDKLCVCQTNNAAKNDRGVMRAASSAYILYPGDILDHEHNNPEVGALPLMPEMAPDKRAQVEDAVMDILIFAGLLPP